MALDYFAVHPIRIATTAHDLGVQQWEREQRLLAKLLQGEPAGTSSKVESPAPVRVVSRKPKMVVVVVAEGDSVAVLEEHRMSYSDILEADKQIALKVVKKYPGRGGGLLVEAQGGTKLKVAASHVRLEETVCT